MKSTICVLPVLACLALISFVSVRADDPPKNPEPYLPSANQTLNCPEYKNCTNSSCHFTGLATETKSKHFESDDTLAVTCDTLKVDIIYPGTKQPDFKGNKTYTCFKYTNENGTSFLAAEVILNKPDDVKGSQATCTFGEKNKCTLVNETASQFILVAGFPSTCTPWAPTPTPTPDTTTAPPASTTTTGTSSTKSDNSTTTVSVPTGAGSNNTGAPTQGATATTSSPVETTTGKGSSDVARLEMAAVLVAASALYIRQYL